MVEPLPPLPVLPVLYLPGASGRSAAFRPIAERLASRRPPLLVDYPGLGDAPAEPGVRSAGDLVELAAARLPERADVAAMSMGCLLALALGLRYPGRVRRMVLLAPAGGVDVAALGGVDWRPAFRAARPTAPTWLLDDRSDLTPLLHGVAAPTLVVVGDRDLISPVAVGRHLVTHLPRSRLEVLAGATHDLEAEHPDVIASLMEAHYRGRD